MSTVSPAISPAPSPAIAPTLSRLAPFGLEVMAPAASADRTAETAPPTDSLPSLPPIECLRVWVREHRVIVLRGFAAPEGDGLAQLGAALGEVLEWSFGAINELRVDANAKNYLYTSREVPFHWDGAFVGRIPAYILFHCASAPPVGGETLFCDTTRLLESASAQDIARWRDISITYTTEKLAHYGGSFTSPMLADHPLEKSRWANSVSTLRFAEPVLDLNPVQLEIHDARAAAHGSASVSSSPINHEAFLADMRRRLRSPNVLYTHTWRPGDVVLADNHALLHGRRAFPSDAPRHIRRVNILFE